MYHSHNQQLVLETSSEIQSCISLIEQAAGLPFNLPAEIEDLGLPRRLIDAPLPPVPQTNEGMA